MATRVKTVHFALGDSTSNKLDAGKVWTKTGGAWADRTATYISAATADVPLGGAVGDELYIGSLIPFVSVCHDTSTAPTGTVAWEYWNGSAWAVCPGLSGSLPTDNTTIRWDRPTDWATTQVNGEGDGPWYYARLRRTGAGTGGTISGGNLGICHQFANVRSVNLPDLTGTPTVRVG
ncbi:MAG: hypothetical protein HC888_06980 [Candidatus Competibacteraceae bacterium]|nr:hypothetical protein [Candidatus Competibacteraceae bacterium]